VKEEEEALQHQRSNLFRIKRIHNVWNRPASRAPLTGSPSLQVSLPQAAAAGGNTFNMSLVYVTFEIKKAFQEV
jgi:hypothetical protein